MRREGEEEGEQEGEREWEKRGHRGSLASLEWSCSEDWAVRQDFFFGGKVPFLRTQAFS